MFIKDDYNNYYNLDMVHSIHIPVTPAIIFNSDFTLKFTTNRRRDEMIDIIENYINIVQLDHTGNAIQNFIFQK